MAGSGVCGGEVVAPLIPTGGSATGMKRKVNNKQMICKQTPAFLSEFLHPLREEARKRSLRAALGDLLGEPPLPCRWSNRNITGP